MITGGDDGDNGAFLVTNLLRTRSEALICDKVSFFKRKILFVVFTCNPSALDFVVSRWSILFFLMLMSSAPLGIPGLCIPLFRQRRLFSVRSRSESDKYTFTL